MKRDLQKEYEIDKKWYLDLCRENRIEPEEINSRIWAESKWINNTWVNHFNALKKARLRVP